MPPQKEVTGCEVRTSRGPTEIGVCDSSSDPTIPERGVQKSSNGQCKMGRGPILHESTLCCICHRVPFWEKPVPQHLQISRGVHGAGLEKRAKLSRRRWFRIEKWSYDRVFWDGCKHSDSHLLLCSFQKDFGIFVAPIAAIMTIHRPI